MVSHKHLNLYMSIPIKWTAAVGFFFGGAIPPFYRSSPAVRNACGSREEVISASIYSRPTPSLRVDAIQAQHGALSSRCWVDSLLAGEPFSDRGVYTRKLKLLSPCVANRWTTRSHVRELWRATDDCTGLKSRYESTQPGSNVFIPTRYITHVESSHT